MLVRKWKIMEIKRRTRREKNRYGKGMLAIPFLVNNEEDTLLMIIPATTQTLWDFLQHEKKMFSDIVCH